MNKLTILIVEDDIDISDILQMYLQAADFTTKVFNVGDGVVSWVQDNSPALAILDVNLPGKDGLTICKEIRVFSNMPIIMATEEITETDRLNGLDIGADDYVCKPFSVKEVVARVKANLRRSVNKPELMSKLTLDTDKFSLSYQTETISLTAMEFSLFKLLYSSPGRIYSRAQIMDLVYQDYREVSDRTVDSHIRNLRKKLNTLPLTENLIHSIYGAGYKFEET
ncbi:response regulator [Thalassomonas actiniarum]|uniref:Response regulator n=1 Tax=Thalassomonas actiniarum TaxID=485447 RepID=A0AAF0C6A5_9GAMM|nr:response regulator [Thalassomonas actiniarum]WDE02413.1 response regulator [Thalassomonas actiniarum]